MVVAVFGASGKFGRFVVEDLRGHGYHVVGFDRAAGDGVVAIDMRDYGQVAEAVQGVDERHGGVDAVVHLAVDWRLESPADERTTLNVRGTQTVVTAAAASGVPRVVVVTSAVVYGALPDNRIPLPEDAPLQAVPEGIVADLLEIERVALAKEEDAASKERLAALDKELADLQEKSLSMKAHWQGEKDAITQIRELKEQLEAKRSEIEREGDLEKAAEIRYGQIPELERQVDAATARLAELQSTQQMLKEEVDEEDVAEVVSKWTGVPVTRLMEGELQKLVRMEEVLHERVIGQDEAVVAVANAIRRSRAGLSDPNRPIGSFLFLGPTGVGKTELARTLADFLFDDERAMVRIDMSEYMEKHAVSRLIGAPPGYVGYDEGGQLTEAVRRRPYSVILFDEIEKAHPDVFNILLQLLDDGRLTDGQGRTVDFRNTVVIMTSNLGSQWFSELAGGNREVLETRVMEELKLHFRPEFLNRIDEVVVFNNLGREEIGKIVDIQLGLLAQRLSKLGLSLEVTPEAKKLLAEEGYDPVYGARPLKRVIQRRLENPLSVYILEGKNEQGGTILVKTDQSGKLVFENRPASGAQ